MPVSVSSQDQWKPSRRKSSPLAMLITSLFPYSEVCSVLPKPKALDSIGEGMSKSFAR